MKKLLFVFSLILSFTSVAQSDLEGKFVIEPTIGIPNAGRMYSAFVGSMSFYSDYDLTNVTGTPVQLGGRLEYISSPMIGFGLEVNYEEANLECTYLDYIYNSTTGEYDDSVQVWGQKKLRFMGRFMFHFGNQEKVDWYTGAALGYTHETQENPENRPSLDDYGFAFFPKLLDRVSNPISARVYIGMRYMLNNHFGFVTEVGIGGGSLIQMGISARF